MKECAFCKIVRGEIPCARIYEDEHVLSFLDIGPINAGHTLVIPKKHYTTLFEIEPEELQACILAAHKVARAVFRGVGASGLNLLQNNFRPAGQRVYHIHFHLIPRHERDGFLPSWPAGSYAPGEMEKTLHRILQEI
jgi:histidine triad (HIT) family protein